MMNPHPYQMHTVVMLRRDDLLRVAARERLAATACERGAPFPPPAVWRLIAGIVAKLTTIAAAVIAPPRRALPTLSSELS